MGSILLAMAVKSFIRNRLSSTFFLLAAFTSITFGNLYADIYFPDSMDTNNIIGDVFNTIGLVALIIAVTKS